MTLFASRRNTRAEQWAIAHELVTLLGAVDVTGLSGWERAKKLHGGLAEGDAHEEVRRGGKASGQSAERAASLSASPVQNPLFEEGAA